MEKKLFIILSVICFSMAFIACGDNDDNDAGNTKSVKDIKVTIDDDGNITNGYRFRRINLLNFYINEIKYTIVDGNHIEVTGYDKDLFYGDADIISMINYLGKDYPVTKIADYAFVDNMKDTTSNKRILSVNIPNSITSIGIEAFADCTNLQKIRLGNGIKNMGEKAFRLIPDNTLIDTRELYLSSLDPWFNKEIFSPSVWGDGHEIDGLTALCMCGFDTEFAGGEVLPAVKVYVNGKHLENLVIPSNMNIKNFVYFNFVYFFWDIKSITFPNAMTTITGFNAFPNLRSIDFPNSVTSIGGFNSCPMLTSVTFPNSVTSIRGFSYCYMLSSVTFPNSVTSIGGFNSCPMLTSVTFPNSVTSIDGFNSCPNLHDVYIYAKNPPVTVINGYNRFRVPDTATIHVPSGCKSKYEQAEGWEKFHNIVDDL